MLREYQQRHTSSLRWEEKYNFDTLEANLAAFEEELKSGRQYSPVQEIEEFEESLPDKEIESENEDTNSLYYVLSHHPSMRHCIHKDDNRELESFDVDPEYIYQAVNYFVSQIWRGAINNAFQTTEDPKQHLMVRFEDVILELNQPNSRCFREILKWHYHLIKEDALFVSLQTLKIK